MKKLLTKILGSCLGFAMAIGVGVAFYANSNYQAAYAGALTYKLTIDTSYFNTTSYSANNNEKTADAICTTDSSKKYQVKWTSYQVMLQSNVMQWQKNNGYIYNSTNLGTISSVTVTKTDGTFTTYYGTSEHPTSGTTVGNGFFTTVVGGATGKTSKVEITFTINDTTYNFTKTGTNCTISGPATGNNLSNATFTINPYAGYYAPESVTLVRGETTLNSGYTYSVSNNVGSLTVNAATITGDISISATSSPIVPTGMVLASNVSTLVSSGGNYVVNLYTGDTTTGAPANRYDEDLTATLSPSDALDKTVTWSKTDASELIDDEIWLVDDDKNELMFRFSTENEGSFIITATANSGTVVKTVTYNIIPRYSITTTVTNGSFTGSTYIVAGGNASVTISADSGFKLPTSVSVTGASHTYSNGVISLSNPTANVVISVTCLPLANYTITVNETEGTHTGPSTIQENGSATLTFTPTEGWGQPNEVTVTGATKSWNKGTGVLTLTNPTANVIVTYSAIENKLDSITLSASSGSYTLGDAFIMPTVTAHYTVAADKNVTASATFSGYDPYSTGAQTVTISYSEGGVEKTSAYTANVSAASYSDITTWTKVTDASTLSVGDLIIIADSTQNVALSDEQRDSNRGAASITKSNNTITWSTTATHVPQQLTLVSTSGVTDAPAGSFGLSPSSGKYLYAAGSSSNYLKTKTTLDKDGSFVISIANDVATIQATASTNRNLMRSNYKNNPSIFSCYASNATTGNPLEVYKKITEPSGTPKVIRIVCDPTIDEDTGYKGGDKYIGDKIRTTDFVVKKQMDTSTELETITDFTINGGTEVTLEETSNTITIEYGGKTATIVVPASERQAELSSVTLKVGKKAKLDGYVDWSGAEWDFTDITVFYDWTDDEFDEEVGLQDLVESGDATISPAKPTLGTTSYTVSYEYMEVEISDGTVTLKEAVAEDYVSSVSWTGKSLANFKAYSGEQLTIDTVNTWTVKAIYKGAGETEARSFGTGADQFTIKVGSKTVNSLPYTWQTEDDGQYIAVVTGGKSKEDHTNAVANICASINAIDHTGTVSGEQTLSNFINTSSDTWDVKKEGTSGTGSEVEIDNAGFTFESDKGYWNGTQIRSYKDSNITISSSYTIKSISFTFSGSYDGGLSDIYDNIDATSKTFSDLGSQARITGISITFIGTATTTTHYANQAGHFEAQKAVVKYAKAFNEAMNGENVCSGTFENLSTAWATASAAYTTFLSDISSLDETEQTFAKEMLTYATAQWSGNAEAACVEKAMKTYEHVVKTYKLTAFMSEVRPVSPSRFTSIFNIDNSNMAPIIVIISMISIAAVGGYFFLRKRKED